MGTATATRALALGLAWAALAATGGSATILRFDETRGSNPANPVEPAFAGASVPDDYGDHVTGPVVAVPGGVFTYGDGGEGFTPNVVVDVFGGANPASNLWETGYGDLVNVAFANQGAESFNIQLTADASYEVELYGFDLGGWSNTDWTIAAVTVLAGAVPLFTALDVVVDGTAGHTSFDFASPLVGSDLRIELDLSNLAFGQQDNVGIDNVRFGQNPPGIPEPGTLALLGLGLAGLASRGRRRASGS